MIYPPFLQRGDRIGITAPSAGVAPEDAAAFDLSLSHIHAAGFRTHETANVRAASTAAPAFKGTVSATPAERAAQLNALFADKETRMIWCAGGGDFLLDMLPYVDLNAAAANPKWVQGYSDPTSLLYALTTVADIATIYGANAGGFDMTTLHPSLCDNLALLRGDVPPQHSFDLYEGSRADRVENGGWALSAPVKWETPHGAVKAQGRLLGGCMDCLSDILGTPFDGTAAFLERYGADGVLWYFDIFALSAETVYRTLWRMRECGWFEHAVGAVFGRVCFPSSPLGVTYSDMIAAALPDLPLVLEADVGHVPPRMTLVNGALATLTAENGKGTLTMELK